MKTAIGIMLLILLQCVSVSAASWRSVYTTLDFDKGCNFYQSDDLGGQAKCDGYKNHVVHFAEGDLRQMVQFGDVVKPFETWESFAQFNRVNTTIEWRLRDGHPVATILRWFIENLDEEAGQPTKRTEGQVLVISSVADKDDSQSCIIGYVDARANKNANVLAHEVADTLGSEFNCGSDLPAFHGRRGPFSGNPSILAE